MQLADERMYSRKRGRTASVGDQTRDVLVQIIHAKKPELGEHSGEVAQLCRRVGHALEMREHELEELGRAAELHDVGKVGIPDSILEREERLDDDESAFVRQHPVLGERILNAVPSLRGVAAIVRSTHERWDGRGYPDGLAGEAIPLASRIIAACDAYEAMRSYRSHRQPRGREEALDELRREAGRQFDPGVVGALLAELRQDQLRAGPREESRARGMLDTLGAQRPAPRPGAADAPASLGAR